MVASATRLLQAIPAGSLNQLLAELATALQNRAGTLRTIVSAGTEFSTELLSYQRQFNQLLANAPPVLDTVAAEGPQLRQALANTETLLEVLSSHASGFTDLLSQGSTSFGQLGSLVTGQSPDLACLVHDLSALSANLAAPANLSNLSESLATNGEFFGAVGSVAVAGTAKALTAGSAGNPDQYFLRTRLLLPPVAPAGIAYARQVGLPAVEPGAGCSTEFGQGAGPATQAGFTPADGGALAPPSAAAAQVRGGGDGVPVTQTQPAAYTARPSDGDPLALAVAGLLCLAFALAWRSRPSQRARRRRG